MRTNTRIEFGLFDVTARQDSSPSCLAAWPWNDVAKDLRQEDRPAVKKYGTLEQRQFLMDGSFELFPNEPKNGYWGLWSRQQSNADGRFKQPPVLEVRFTQPHSSAGITLHFYEPTQDWASEVQIQWYDAEDHPLGRSSFAPDGVDFYCKRTVVGYTRLRITFLGTNHPGRYLKLSGIDYGVALTFSGQEVVEAHVLEEIDPLSDQISINTLNLTLYNRQKMFSILNPDGVFDALQHKQRFTVWEEVQETPKSPWVDHNMGTFYLSEWSNDSDTLAEFAATDAVGLLDAAPYDGGIYDTTAEELMEDLLSGYAYQLDASFTKERIRGYLPVGTRRSALQQAAFALGAVVDCSRSDKIKIYPLPSRPSSTITSNRKLEGSKVHLRPLITGVEVTAHRYQLGTEIQELYKDTLPKGTHEITLSEPAAGITVSGAELVKIGNNAVVVQVSEENEVVLKGRTYSDTNTVIRQRMKDLPPNTQENLLRVEQATLVCPDRALAVAQRILNYYDYRYEMPFRMIAGNELLADMIILESFGGVRARGVLEKLEFDLTGGYLADARLVGTRLGMPAEAYLGEIYTAERSLI